MISVPGARFLSLRRRATAEKRAGAPGWHDGAATSGRHRDEAASEPRGGDATARRRGGGGRLGEQAGRSRSGTDGARTSDEGSGSERSDAERDSGERAFLGRVGVRVGLAVRAVPEPFRLAFFRGDADPPPKARRPAIRVPKWLRLLVPFATVNLIQVAELLLALFAYMATLSMLWSWNADPPRPPAGSGPVWDGFVYLTAAAVGLPIALRDRWPLAAWRVSIVLFPVAEWVTKKIGGASEPYLAWLIVSYLLVLYAVAVRCDRRITVAVWGVTFLGTWIVDPNSMPVAMVIVSVVVLFGYNVRVRRSATAKLKVEKQRTQQAESAQAVLAERARIARELHDVVAHHMSVIAIQAEAVPLRARGDAAQLEAGLAEIRGLSLEAIAELRQVLGVLRDQDGRVDTAPQPGLDRLDELVSNARAAGLAVLVKRSGPLDRLPPAVGLSAYRIVQESLSNAMRHAPGATVALDIAHKRGELRLRVANGPVAAPGAGPGAGQGLVGMRERVTLLGGALDAGPVPGGGFEVRATLPVTGVGEEATTP
ncbi:sensor histidine kinase [Nonomuraea sp. NPDC050153]|uniref:sensor histidine kinase n=1 Tax=Nonomuraea sp. NPDC050153 TaxID=3364359 RepID=UPI00379F171D